MNANNQLEMFLSLNAEAFKKGLSVAGTSVRTMAGGASTAFATTRAKLQENLTAVKGYNTELGRQGGILSTLKGHVLGLAGAVGVSISVIAGMGKLINVTREFDRLNAGLITATGSAAGAKEKFAAIQDFAARTPYDLAQVTDSFIKLVNFGLNPTDRAMTSYGNTASAMGKDLNMMIEAVADAATGEFERLKEFGIKAKSEGDRVSFTFRGITTTVGKNAQEIEEYLIKLGETNFGDAMANRMSSLDGALSNLGDEWDKLFLNISQSGVGDAIAATVRIGISALESLNEKVKSGELLEWARAHKEVLITIGSVIAGVLALAIGAAALAPVIYTLTAAWRGMNAVMLLTSGSQIIPWLGSIVTTLKAVEIGALGLKGVIGGFAGVFMAWEVGWNVGTFLRKFDVVERAGISMAAGLTKGWYRAKLAWAEFSHGDVEGAKKQLDEADKIYAEMFADVGKGAKDAADEQKKAQQDVADGAKKSADQQSKAQKGATDAMKKAYQDYADTVKKLQDDIAGREQDLAAQLREMGRSGMSDMSAWKDRKTQAEEYAAAAKRAGEESKRAFAAGDAVGGQSKAAEAVSLYDKAKDAAADLNREVKAGDTVIASQEQNLKTALTMVEEYGRGAIGVQNNLQEAIKQSAQALDTQSGGQLSKELPEVAKQFGELKVQAGDLAEASAKFNDDWNNAWSAFLADGKKSVGELDSELSQLTKDRHIKVYVEEIEKKKSGGLLGYMHGGIVQALAAGGSVARNILAGGFLPGFGGGDRRLLLGEDGEVMLNKNVVQLAGKRAALAFNAGRWDVVISELMQRFKFNMNDVMGYQLGGMISSLPSVQTLSGGGAVEVTGPNSSGKMIRHEHVLRAGNASAKVYTDDLNASRLLAVFERAARMSS